MSYNVKISWKKNSNDNFTEKKYSRVHKWTFDSGIEVRASSSPHVVPIPYSDENAVDPEEAFVAALSSCHMLSFLFIAAKEKFVIESYEDKAEGVLKKNNKGKLAMTHVTLKPRVVFTGEKIPTRNQIDKMHHLAHEECFIANSVKTEIVIELQPEKEKSNA